jgi:hypothetical protein
MNRYYLYREPTQHRPTGNINISRVRNEQIISSNHEPSLLFVMRQTHDFEKSSKQCEHYYVGLLGQDGREVCGGDKNFCLDCFAKKINLPLPDKLCRIVVEYCQDITVKIKNGLN